MISHLREFGGRVRLAISTRRQLAAYARPHRHTFAGALLLTILQVAVEVLRPWPIKVVVDQVILNQPWDVLPARLSVPEHRAELLIVSAAAVLVLAALSGTILFSRNLLLARSGQLIVADVRKDLFKKLLRLPLGFHDAQRSGDLVIRLTGDASAMKILLAEGSFALIQELLWTVSVFVVMATLDPGLALLAALSFPLVGLVVFAFGRRLRGAARRQRQKEGLIAAAVGESLRAVPVIQAYGLEEEAAKRFRGQNRKSLRAGLAAARFEGSMSRWTELALALGTALLLLLGARRVMSGTLTAGEMLVLISYGRNLYKPLRRIATRVARLLKAAACAERLLEVLELPDSPAAPARRASGTAGVGSASTDSIPSTGSHAPPSNGAGAIAGAVGFEGAVFAYDGADPVLSGLDLEIGAGEHVGILGPNGAGKSTLVSLIPRLLEVTDGRVTIDEIDVKQLDPARLRASVAMVFQNSLLFDGDILENLRLGRPDASEEEILAAARLAGVTEFAAELRNGLHTPVGENGSNLSGGQRQRIALARALLRDASILVLDEPTSSLDAKARGAITGRILEGLRGRTVLLISHRSELLLRMDRVVVIEDGRCTASGTPLEILAGATSAPDSDGLVRLATGTSGERSTV